MNEPRMETTKRFPRTLSEAFPREYPDQFYMLQGYRPRMHPDLPVVIMCVFAAGFVVGLLVAGA
jgi:hypothetical protein